MQYIICRRFLETFHVQLLVTFSSYCMDGSVTPSLSPPIGFLLERANRRACSTAVQDDRNVASPWNNYSDVRKTAEITIASSNQL
jgi:hypothetical protein